MDESLIHNSKCKILDDYPYYLRDQQEPINVDSFDYKSKRRKKYFQHNLTNNMTPENQYRSKRNQGFLNFKSSPKSPLTAEGTPNEQHSNNQTRTKRVFSFEQSPLLKQCLNKMNQQIQNKLRT